VKDQGCRTKTVTEVVAAILSEGFLPGLINGALNIRLGFRNCFWKWDCEPRLPSSGLILCKCHSTATSSYADGCW